MEKAAQDEPEKMDERGERTNHTMDFRLGPLRHLLKGSMSWKGEGKNSILSPQADTTLP